MKSETKKSQKQKKNSLRFHLLSLGGSLLILAVIVGISYEFYIYGIENKVYTNNYTTSVLFSDTLRTATGAAPLALFSLNFFICRTLIKKWRKFVKRLG